MNYKKLDKNKIRARLVRKGFFTQFKPLHRDLEGENRLFRTVVDHALFDATSDEKEERKQAFKWFNPESSCVNDFNTVCLHAGLEPERTRIMMLNFLDKFFPEVFEQTSCSFRL